MDPIRPGAGGVSEPAKSANQNDRKGPIYLETIKTHATEARGLQSQRKFKSADEKWQLVEHEISEAGNPPELEMLRRETTENRGSLRPLLDEKNLMDHFEPSPKSPENRPAEIKSADLLRYYPAGRTVQSDTQFVIRGQGTSKDWIFKGDAQFLSLDNVATESKVQENDGHRVKFTVSVHRRFPPPVCLG